MNFPALQDQIGNTRLVRLQKIADNSRGNVILAKLEGDNPAGSERRANVRRLVGHLDSVHGGHTCCPYHAYGDRSRELHQRESG